MADIMVVKSQFLALDVMDILLAFDLSLLLLPTLQRQLLLLPVLLWRLMLPMESLMAASMVVQLPRRPMHIMAMLLLPIVMVAVLVDIAQLHLKLWLSMLLMVLSMVAISDVPLRKHTLMQLSYPIIITPLWRLTTIMPSLHLIITIIMDSLLLQLSPLVPRLLIRPLLWMQQMV